MAMTKEDRERHREEILRRRAQPVLPLAEKWGPVFGAPISSIMTVAQIESAFDPKRVSPVGAYGLMQQMLNEAPYKLARIKATYGKLDSDEIKRLAERFDPNEIVNEIKRVAKRFNGKGESLFDPDLNVMLGAWQLGQLHRKFDNFLDIAAAYNQGEHAVEKRLAAGKPAVSKDTPAGLAYVAEARKTYPKYLAADGGQLALADE